MRFSYNKLHYISVMKYFFFSILLFITNILFAEEGEVNILFSLESSEDWQFISDRTMGGVSDGQAFLDRDGDLFFARLIGNVSTDNNGGFIQLRSILLFEKLYKENKTFLGVRLNVRGNREIYHIFIRTSENRTYRDFFSATFVADDDWQTVDLPFSQFKQRYSNNSLDGNDIKTFAIVAYGRDFISDVSISKITFYNE